MGRPVDHMSGIKGNISHGSDGMTSPLSSKTFFLDLAASAKTIAYSLFSDVLTFAVRPLAIVCAVFPNQLPTLETMLDGGILYGFLSTISVLLIGLSLASLGVPEPVVRVFFLIYGVDGLAQLPVIVWPAAAEIWHYPVSHTGILVTTVQLKYCLPLAMGVKSAPDREIESRTWLLSFAIPLRYMSLALVDPHGPSSYILYGMSVILLTFAITPRSFWEFMRTCLEKAVELARYVFSSVYAVLEYICPIIKDTVLAIMQHPLLVGVYQNIISPAWELVSPWFLPLALLLLACSCVQSLTQSVAVIPRVLSDLFVAITASASFCILALHSASRMCRREQPDPLRLSCLAGSLTYLSQAISFPWWLLCKLWHPIRVWLIQPATRVFFEVLEILARFACQCPFLSIPCVIIFNVLLIKYLPNVLEACSPLKQPFQFVWQAVLHMQSATIAGNATDSGLAIVLIMAVQIAAYHAVACALEAVRIVRAERTGHILSLDELNELAVAMDDPRQCARCGFGPVDHRGCSNLRSHHMEVSVRGGSRSTVSNACPRCDWFTGNLQDWPSWDGELQTARGRAMFRQRVWCEIVVVIRASSKAILFPFCLLALGSWLNLPASISAFLAFSYLIPWAMENRKLAEAINSPHAYRRSARTRYGSQTVVPTGDRDANCGAAPQAPLLPAISQSEALQNILTGIPANVFLAQGDICSVCLEPFSSEAVLAVNSGTSVPSTCQALQALKPSVVALRCGHPLHVECAEAAVTAGGARHVRCPLCREPVTLSGDATAAMFS